MSAGASRGASYESGRSIEIDGFPGGAKRSIGRLLRHVGSPLS
jgi:hypothetical protein